MRPRCCGSPSGSTAAPRGRTRAATRPSTRPTTCRSGRTPCWSSRATWTSASPPPSPSPPSPPCSAAASRAGWWSSRTRTTGCSSRPTAASGTPRCSAGSTGIWPRPTRVWPRRRAKGGVPGRGRPLFRGAEPSPPSCVVSARRRRALLNRLKDNANWRVVRDRALVPAGARARAWRDRVQANDPVYAAARRPGPPEKIAATVTLLLVAAVILFLLLFDWNLLRGPIGRWASARYDREIQLNGDLDVNLFSWTPSARVRDLRIGGPDWAREKDTLTVEDLRASVRLRALLTGNVEMPLVQVVRPRAVLVATADGRQSWRLDPDAPDTGEGLKLPPINRLLIQDGRLTLDERRRNIRLEAVVNAREGSDGDAGFHLDGEGTINGTPLTVRVSGGPFINIRRDRPYAFHGEVSGVGTRLVADGAITRPFDLGQFSADLTLEGRDLADLYLLTG